MISAHLASSSERQPEPPSHQSLDPDVLAFQRSMQASMIISYEEAEQYVALLKKKEEPIPSVSSAPAQVIIDAGKQVTSSPASVVQQDVRAQTDGVLHTAEPTSMLGRLNSVQPPAMTRPKYRSHSTVAFGTPFFAPPVSPQTSATLTADIKPPIVHSGDAFDEGRRPVNVEPVSLPPMPGMQEQDMRVLGTMLGQILNENGRLNSRILTRACVAIWDTHGLDVQDFHDAVDAVHQALEIPREACDALPRLMTRLSRPFVTAVRDTIQKQVMTTTPVGILMPNKNECAFARKAKSAYRLNREASQDQTGKKTQGPFVDVVSSPFPDVGDDTMDLEEGDCIELDEYDDEEPAYEDIDFEALGIDPTAPTLAKPGSEEKVLMLVARYQAGVPLWHDRDCYEHGPAALESFLSKTGGHPKTDTKKPKEESAES